MSRSKPHTPPSTAAARGRSLPADAADEPFAGPSVSRAIVNAIPDMLFRISRDGVFRSFEGSLEDLYYPPNTYLGYKVTEVLPADVSHTIMKHLKLAFETGAVQVYEYQLAFGDQQRCYETRMIQCLPDEVLAIVRNITHRKQIEADLIRYRDNLEQLIDERTAELAMVQEFYRAIFEKSGAGSVIVEDDLTISTANPRFEQLSGYSREQIEGRMKWVDFLVKEDAARVKMYHRARRSGSGAPNEYECRLRDRSGAIKHIFIKIGMIPGQHRSITSVIDITSLKETEHALREREALYSAILEGYEGLIYFISNDYRIRFMNERLIDQVGRNATGEVCYRAIHQRNRMCPWCVSDQVFKGRSVRFEMKNPRDKRWYYSVNTPIRHADGTISYQAMIMDIHDRKMLEEALKESEAYLRKENTRLRSTIKDRYKFGDIVGKSQAMQAVYELILNAAGTDANIIIYGESGTGKELVAKMIHQLSDRKEKPFVPVNCGAIPENLLESEFFGSRKGAFSGAASDKKGYLDVADGGTLFLDEVGEIKLNIQVKLLRAIEGGGYTPVGGRELIKPNLRIVAATNRNLPDLVNTGQMREDFYYRIHIIPLRLPPLRERLEDLPLLVDHFLKGYDAAQRPKVNPQLMEALRAYHWPGNVRELQNVLHRYVTLGRLDLDVKPDPGAAEAPPGLAPPGLALPGLALPGEVAASVQAGFNTSELRTAVETFEKAFIRHELRRHKGNRRRAARAMGIGLRTIHRKIKTYDITD